MKRLVLAMAVLALSASVAFAGPNDGATLTVHGNVDGVETNGDPCGAIEIPTDCDQTVPAAAPDGGGVEWFLVLAAGDGLAFNTCTFGVGNYSTGECYIGFYGPCRGDLNPLEIPSAGWPGPNSGTAVSWAPNCLTGDLVAVYYFGVYVYAGGIVPLGNFFPGQQAGLVSCDQPPEEDPFADYGTFGCGGIVGDQACPPDIPQPGACCLPDGTCMMLTEDECLAAGWDFFGGPCDPNPCPPPVEEGACCIDGNGDGNPETCIVTTAADCMDQNGVYQGDGTDCDPNPCPPDPPVATQKSTWGQIKSIYR